MDETQAVIMKKLIFTIAVAALAANALHAEIKPVQIAEIPSNIEMAMTVNNENVAVMQPACVYQSGSDIRVIIYSADNKFTVEEQFTISNVKTDNCNLSGLWIESADLASVVVTKNFFVKNDKWCVSFSSYANGEIYQIIDEDGNSLGYLPAGSEVNIYLDRFYQGTPYLLVSEYDSQSDRSTSRLYTFTDESGVESVAVPMSKAYPNPLPSGETFTVELETPADNATFFSVTDMKGRQVFRGRVPAGESTYKVPGLHVGHGHYIYTVVYSNGEIASGRLMAE